MRGLVKIVAFVSKSHADIVRWAIGNAGAGRIGNYSHCSFSIKEVGRYKPMEGARPFLGTVGQFEEVQEERVGFICDKSKAKEVIAAVRKVHPYEEVAFDIYPLLSEEELS
jgi:hypothetical protein